MLPQSIFFRQGGFEIGETLYFTDMAGKEHIVEIGPSPTVDTGETKVYLSVDHYPRMYSFEAVEQVGVNGKKTVLSKEEIMDLAMAGDMRAGFAGNLVEISVKEGQEVKKGDRVAVMEAMKMQTPVTSEVDGIVTAISAKAGQAIRITSYNVCYTKLLRVLVRCSSRPQSGS